MRKKLNQAQVMRLLKRDGYYLENYTFDCTVYSDDGDDMGHFSIRVFDELLKAGKIEYAGRNEMFWTKGYYRAVETKCKYCTRPEPCNRTAGCYHPASAAGKNLIKTGT